MNMAGALSKRQQARNEKTLQDLVQNVPGNNQCADCQARNPGQSRLPMSLVDGPLLTLETHRLGIMERTCDPLPQQRLDGLHHATDTFLPL